MMIADSQIPLDGVFQEKAILDNQWLVQSQGFPHLLYVRRRSIRRHEQGKGISGQMKDGKDDPSDHEKNDEGLIDASEDIEGHVR
jgi:hypothetical protein